MAKPVVLMPACNRVVSNHASHTVGRKYVEAAQLAGTLPLVVPTVELADDGADIEDLLARVDGVLLTGSPSNVHPSNFGAAVHDASLPLDPERDGWVLAMIPRVLARGMPLLAICRGAQEVNVALGGSLHQAVQEVPGYADHRDPDGVPLDVAYGPAHRVDVVRGGALEAITGASSFDVNSLHGQGIHRPAAGLRVEAVAPDGLTEAFSIGGAPGFNLALQWHPEWQAAANPVSMRILQAFGAAVRQYRDRVRGPLPVSATA